MQTLRPTMRRARRAGRVSLALAVTVTVAGLMAGCDAPRGLENDAAQSGVDVSAPLPADQQLRNVVAQSEAAISQRLMEMSLSATECEECAAALEPQAQAALGRLSDSGGVWAPHSPTLLTASALETRAAELVGADDAAGPSLARLDPSVFLAVDAPFTVGPLAAFMARTAREQLQDTAEIPDLDSNERLALGAIAAGRLASAHALADFYAVNLRKAEEYLPAKYSAAWSWPTTESDDPPSVEGGLGEGQSGQDGSEADESGPGGSDGSGSSGSASPEIGSTSAEARALITFDCVRTGLLRQDHVELGDGGTKASADRLNSRMTRLLEGGVPDERELRCPSPPLSLQAALRETLTADLELLGSQDAKVRAQAVTFVESDLSWWARVDPQTLPSDPLLVIGDDSDE